MDNKLLKLVKPFADAFISEDSVVSNLRVEALRLGGEVLDATARMTTAERKDSIEEFIASVCKARGYAASSIADRKSLFRSMIYASPHADVIVKVADYSANTYPQLYQRSRQIEKIARHVKSRLNTPAEITQKALKAWIDADAAKRAKGKAKAAKLLARGPMAKLQDALAHFADAAVDWSDAIAAGYVSKQFIADCVKLHSNITPAMVKSDKDFGVLVEAE
jgi:hypothetical protein